MSLVQQWPIEMIALELVDEQEANPNEMTGDEFSALVDEIMESGWLVPIQIRGPYPNGRYKMIGGHHRAKAAKVLGLDEVSAVVIDAETFDEDWDEIQLVKQNVLHGSLNPTKFTDLYNRLAKKYDPLILRELMAFTKKDAFEKVYQDAKKALPPEMQEKLEDVREELQTVDQLSLVLNRLFTQYGNMLDFNGMYFVWGGKDHLMIRLQNAGQWQRVRQFAEWCVENEQKMDEALMTRMDWPTV